MALPGREQNLVLHQDSTWAWVPRTLVDSRQAVCGCDQANEFSWVDVTGELLPPRIEALLRWQLRIHHLAESLQVSQRLFQQLAEISPDEHDTEPHDQAVDTLLKACGIKGLYELDGLDYANFVPYDEEELAPATREACYAHISEYVELDETGRAAAAELIQLAWLWANELVAVNYATGWSQTDERYDIDGSYDPVRQEDTTSLHLYQFYALDQLGPFLRNNAAAR